MNIKEQPCEENPNYSFMKCLESVISTKVGCSSPWVSTRASKVCWTKSQIAEIEQENSFAASMEFSELYNYTGCRVPCTYTEYSLVDTPVVGLEKLLGIFIMFGSGTEVIAKDQRVYTWDLFVADMGGCLGLFLGFSLLALIDFMVILFSKVSKFLRI